MRIGIVDEAKVVEANQLGTRSDPEEFPFHLEENQV